MDKNIFHSIFLRNCLGQQQGCLLPKIKSFSRKIIVLLHIPLCDHSSPESHVTHLTSGRGMWAVCPCLPDNQQTFTRIQSGKIKIFFNASHIFRQNIEEYVAAENIHGIHLTFNVTFAALCPRRILTVSLYFSSPINVSGADRKGLSSLSPLWDLRCWDRSERHE